MRTSYPDVSSHPNLNVGQGTAEALLERLAAGEPAAVGQVYDLHHKAVRAFGQRLIGDAAAAEDLVHDVFVALPQAIARYRGDASLRTFLLGVAVNHARHHVRAAARRRAAMTRYAEEDPGREGPTPEEELRRRQLADALKRALDELPLDQRVAFVLCEVEERTSKEVAEIVGAPEGTVRTRLFHAKRRLREALAAEGGTR